MPLSETDPDRPRAGRPTRAQAQRRIEALLDAALALFLERGFDRATLEEIVTGLGMSKRTVRARFPDKRALFVAAVGRGIERTAVPATALWAAASDDLEATLLGVARLSAGAAGAAGGRLRRLIDAESYRFPDLARQAHDRAVLPTIGFVADLLRRHAERGTIRADRPELAAAAFVAMIGTILLEDGIADMAALRYLVALFLGGLRRG